LHCTHIMNRTFKTRIYPNNKQASILNGSCGFSRFAYNQGLSLWDDYYKAGGRPNYYSVKKVFNRLKRAIYTWTYDYSKWIGEAALQDLSRGFDAFFKGNARHPRFHKKGVHDSFRIDGSAVKVEEKRLKLPKGLTLKMAEPFRYEDCCTKVYNVTVSKQAGRWFVSISCEVPDTAGKSHAAVGIDLGIHVLMALSDGTVVENPRWYRRRERRMKHLQREVSRKRKGSKNREKAKKRLAGFQYRTACMRSDYIHKATTSIADSYGVVFLEDLNVKGMERNRHLAKSISDASMSMVSQQLSYKTTVGKIDRWYPSSKTCSNCGCIQDMPLHVRTYTCPDCGAVIDRDVNAAMNIYNVGVANYSELMPVEGVDANEAERSVKQESSSNQKIA